MMLSILKDVFANNVVTGIAANITAEDSTVELIGSAVIDLPIVTPAEGSETYTANITLTNTAKDQYEILQATASAAGVGSNMIYTVTRAHDGTSSYNWDAADCLATISINRDFMQRLIARVNDYLTNGMHNRSNVIEVVNDSGTPANVTQDWDLSVHQGCYTETGTGKNLNVTINLINIPDDTAIYEWELRVFSHDPINTLSITFPTSWVLNWHNTTQPDVVLGTLLSPKPYYGHTTIIKLKANHNQAYGLVGGPRQLMGSFKTYPVVI